MNMFRKFVVLLGMLVVSNTLFAAVNINTANAEELAKAIKGIGASKAEAIVAYREQNGPFTTVEDLAKIKGIGKKTVEKNRGNLSISESE